MNLPLSVRILAFLRGALGTVFSVALVLAPEQMMPGSSAEPARTLALSLAARTLVLALGLVACAVRGERQALRGLFAADALLQVFDVAISLRQGADGTLAVPIAIGLMEAWAVRRLAPAPR